MTRKNPTLAQKDRLLEANAFRCCVCKRPSLGFNFHHLDGDASNTVDSNLAVLCVEDHDAHHRPSDYGVKTSHSELNSEEILRLKISWEAFVTEAKKAHPAVRATLSCFGTEELIHSLQLVLHWPDGRIECTRSYHLLEGSPEKLTDDIQKDLQSISTSMTMAVVDKPLDVEYCPCCATGLSHTIRPAMVARLTDPKWSIESLCSIYINPSQPSLALTIFFKDASMLQGSLHLCQGKFLHYHCDTLDERVAVTRTPSVRSQATRVIRHILNDWKPAKTLIGTGNPEAPDLISDLELPRLWELGI